jgi:hypothetical protein
MVPRYSAANNGVPSNNRFLGRGRRILLLFGIQQSTVVCRITIDFVSWIQADEFHCSSAFSCQQWCAERQSNSFSEYRQADFIVVQQSANSGVQSNVFRFQGNVVGVGHM